MVHGNQGSFKGDWLNAGVPMPPPPGLSFWVWSLQLMLPQERPKMVLETKSYPNSFFNGFGPRFCTISGSRITPKSIQDQFDTSKTSQEAPKTDFGAPKTRPKAFDSAPRRLPNGVLEAPKRLLVRLLDRLRHQQEGFLTIQTHSDVSLS